MTTHPKNKTANKFIPYGCQDISDDDMNAVLEVLRSDFLTTGPQIKNFEQVMTKFTGAKHAVAVSSGTAALHAAMFAIDLGPGDEVILPPITFAATANAVVYQGGKPVFADVVPQTLLIDPRKVEDKITSKTKAIIAVDYSGHPCDYNALRHLADKYNLYLLADACHALGAEYFGKKIGTLADLTVFSFHPVKHITTGEGGMIVTDHPQFTARMRRFRNHGISADHNQRASQETWYYEMTELGYNYRITDFQCALGASQIRRLPGFLSTHRKIAEAYDHALGDSAYIKPLSVMPHVRHAYHLYVVKIDFQTIGTSRAAVFRGLRKKGIGVNVHYIPVHLHPFYKEKFGTDEGLCPIAETAYDQLLSLPMHASMGINDTTYITDALNEHLSVNHSRLTGGHREVDPNNIQATGANHV